MHISSADFINSPAQYLDRVSMETLHITQNGREIAVLARPNGHMPESVIETPRTETGTDRISASSMKGFLKDYADPDLIALEKGAWERAAVEKHGNT
jgi:hypothetical protein